VHGEGISDAMGMGREMGIEGGWEIVIERGEAI
jgi:hypothetical protein